jgi:hypothetical protein
MDASQALKMHFLIRTVKQIQTLQLNMLTAESSRISDQQILAGC